MTTTCSRCLSGTHRCLTAGCACSCNGPHRAMRVPHGGVLRSPRPSTTRRVASPRTGAVGMAMSTEEKRALPGQVLGLVEMLRQYQLTGELA